MLVKRLQPFKSSNSRGGVAIQSELKGKYSCFRDVDVFGANESADVHQVPTYGTVLISGDIVYKRPNI